MAIVETITCCKCKKTKRIRIESGKPMTNICDGCRRIREREEQEQRQIAAFLQAVASQELLREGE